ncbi:MAG TPA: hypothetical protein VMF89_00850, partial [Polyangiales bacterium]|nr:hypothetical protein [Polyangiales bacterium]
LASCTFRETLARCETSADCGSGQECYLHYCVISEVASETATGSAPTEQAGQPSATEPTPELTDCQPASTVLEQEGACCAGPVSCYDGPDGTMGVGTCKAGTRACEAGKLSVCSESVGPREESCENPGSDDDCDGRVDELEGRGGTCTLMSGFGPCGAGRLDCVEGMGGGLSCVREGPPVSETCNAQDEDCDGHIDEGFDFSTDGANCGGCGQTCSGDELCCGGVCLATSVASESGCPACSTENPCADAASCCGGACRDFKHDRRHCGSCGHSCEQAQRCCEGTCSTSCD